MRNTRFEEEFKELIQTSTARKTCLCLNDCDCREMLLKDKDIARLCITKAKARKLFEKKQYDLAILCEGYDGRNLKAVQAHLLAMMDEFQAFERELFGVEDG